MAGSNGTSFIPGWGETNFVTPGPRPAWNSALAQITGQNVFLPRSGSPTPQGQAYELINQILGGSLGGGFGGGGAFSPTAPSLGGSKMPSGGGGSIPKGPPANSFGKVNLPNVPIKGVNLDDYKIPAAAAKSGWKVGLERPSPFEMPTYAAKGKLPADFDKSDPLVKFLMQRFTT